MSADPLFSFQHVMTAYVYGVISFALRTIPKPTNNWALWAMGVVQYAFMNLAEGTDNVKTASSNG